MSRPMLPDTKIAPLALKAIHNFHTDVVQHVANTVKKDAIVVVGMAQNPFVRKARRALDQANLQYTYIEYGSYFSAWHQRLAIKLWSGWPTFPQIFVKGQLIGGYTDLEAYLASGELLKILGG